MCGLTGVLLSKLDREDHELCAAGDLFTRLLVASEHRGPFATGVALIKSSGDYIVHKAPASASQFVNSRDYRFVLDRLDQDATLLMGHTRWPTLGSHLDNANNHPLVGDGKRPCIVTHYAESAIMLSWRVTHARFDADHPVHQHIIGWLLPLAIRIQEYGQLYGL